MITKFKLSEDKKTVSWQHDSRLIELHFQYRVLANHIKYLDEVIVQSDIQESGQKNLAIYKADGSLKARPNMPKLKGEVGGVYAVWFEQGKKQITVVLHADLYKPYQTACTFDLETYEFSKFHETR